MYRNIWLLGTPTCLSLSASPSTTQHFWQPPSIGRLKFICWSPGKSSYGILVRNAAEGPFMRYGYGSFTSPFAAECFALWMSLLVLTYRGWSVVGVESDNLQLILLMQDFLSTPHRQFIKDIDCCRLVAHHLSCNFMHARRQANCPSSFS